MPDTGFRLSRNKVEYAGCSFSNAKLANTSKVMRNLQK